MHLTDARQVDEALALIAERGATAAQEASRRAGCSRDRGNAVLFCRWRQTERLIALLAEETVPGSVH